jgi:ferrochelatase
MLEFGPIRGTLPWNSQRAAASLRLGVHDLECLMTIVAGQGVSLPRFDDEAREYDALLVLSFGGPEGPDDVLPFLENVTRGRGVPRERLLEVAEHYHHFGGVSPINAQNRALIAALETELAGHGLHLPIYFGNRNWHPLLTDTLMQMRADGVKRMLVFVTSAFSSYSGCRQYREDLERATAAIGTGAPEWDKIRVFYNHPGFLEAMADRMREALATFPEASRDQIEIVYTAHSIPMVMARSSAYESQLREAARVVSELAGVTRHQLAYQSRSGAPHVPWLEPDILDVLNQLHERGTSNVIVAPIGFISDHLEVLFDRDEEAAERAAGLGIRFVRAGTVGTHPRFITMIRELIEERLTASPTRPTLGSCSPVHDNCPADCCPLGASRPMSTQPAAVSTP